SRRRWWALEALPAACISLVHSKDERCRGFPTASPQKNAALARAFRARSSFDRGILLCQYHDRPHFDAAESGQWNARTYLDGFGVGRRLDQDEAKQVFLRFGEGSVGDDDLAFAHAHGLGALQRFERLGGDELAAFLERLVVVETFLGEGLRLRLG